MDQNIAMKKNRNENQGQNNNTKFQTEFIVQNNQPDNKPQDAFEDQNYNNAQHIINQHHIEEDLELKRNINNEMLKMRNNIFDQQNQVLKQINDLKAETQNSNMQRFEALKEISALKEELAKQRSDEELRKKYVYDVLIDNSSKVSNVYGNTQLPNLDKNEYKLELPKNYANAMNEQMYEEAARFPNRIPKVPRLDDLDNTNGKFKVSSKFIDIDTHNVIEVI